jgi:ribA/ribD-fused uncharacterized protein
MNIDIVSSFPDPLDKPSLDFLIELYDKEDNLLWIEVCSKISEDQLNQVLNTISERDEEKWREEYEAMSNEEKDVRHRTSALYYARDHNYFTLEDEYAVVNNLGVFAKSGIDYISATSDPELYQRLVRRKQYMDSDEKFFLYNNKDSFLASCYPCSIEVEGFVYNSFSSYVAFEKAKVFRDRSIMDKVRGSTKIEEAYSFGSQVKYFIDIVWAMVIPEIFRKGLRCKFSQNPTLLKMLAQTNGYTIVLASVESKKWGCGLALDNPLVNQRREWKGQNLLGELLTEIRYDLTGRY